MNQINSPTVHEDRPSTPSDPKRVRGAGGVRIVLRRELATKFFTKAFTLSTLLFALLSLAGTALLGSGEDEAHTLGHTPEAGIVAQAAGQLGGNTINLEEVDSRATGQTLVDDGEVDAVLVAQGDGYDVLVASSLDPQVSALLEAAVADQSLREVAAQNSVPADELAEAAAGSRINVVSLGEDMNFVDVLLGLGFAAGAVVVVVLWGIPLATDVMQEKVSRVVEILLISVRPWQLLAGKVLATTLIGVTQLVVVLGAAAAGTALSGELPNLAGFSWSMLIVGSVCLILSIITCSTLMAGLAARVERQEDLSSALQPVFAIAMLPLAAAVYLVFDFVDSPWLDVASMAPFFNTFVLPARLAAEAVPLWQIAISLSVAVFTAVAAFALAGRVYAGAVLRSGGRVTLREALQRQ